MKAAFIRETGPADKIIYGDLPDPTPGPRDIVIRTGAVAVNPIDTYIRNGSNYWPLPQPYIVGCDVAGSVVAVGSDVQRFKVGARVWGSNQGLMGRQGTFAEYVCGAEEWFYPTPAGVQDEAAAACALVGITAHLGLFQNARLQAGEIVFVNGGSGGVGSVVIQLAKAAGARVIATAGSDDKCAICMSLGADLAINYRTQNVAELTKVFAPGGVQVFWETTREPQFDAIVPLLAERGRIVLMAGREARPVFPVGPFYVKGCSMHGFVMFKATPDEQRVCAEDLNRWLASGQLQPRIGREFRLSEAAQAHQLQEDNTLRQAGTLAGKIVLRP
ncbi:MAG: NADPH:quinone reductase [Planctomycetota bacterium]